MRVSELINHQTRAWNNAMVKEVEAILNIQLSRVDMEDQTVWADMNTGQYSVKYGYFKARDWLRKRQYDKGQRKECWKLLWSSAALQKDNFAFVEAPGKILFREMFECKVSKDAWDDIWPDISNFTHGEEEMKVLGLDC
ncbi:hypothetical protein DITRI_Ditri17bG0037900 [Diplodiscus trichospermus]